MKRVTVMLGMAILVGFVPVAVSGQKSTAQHQRVAQLLLRVEP